MKNKIVLKVFVCFFLAILGVGFGAFIASCYDMPSTEAIEGESDVYYSLKNTNELSIVQNVSPKDGEVSVHFLELANKYTGDCTYIKVGKDIYILIDCGSKSSSISYVKEYLDNYVTDGILEYVIITHAHRDHYAGFATSTKLESIFDIYYCQNIITFSQVVEGKSDATYNNYLRELNDTKNNIHKEVYNNPQTKAKSNVYTAKECINNENGATNIFTLINEESNKVSLEILNSYFYTNTAKTENEHSVCCLITHNDKHFLFTGDLEAKGEQYLISMNDFSAKKADLLKAGHHGSKTSSSNEFLSATIKQNAIVCVCCCAGSSEYTTDIKNQFPTKDFINRISQYTTYVYVTTMCINYKENKFASFNGNIAIISQGQINLSVYCSNNTTLLKDSDWFKQNRLELCSNTPSEDGLYLHNSWK